MLHRDPAQFRAPLTISYIVDQEAGEIASRKAAFAAAPRSHKIGLRLCRIARERGFLSDASYSETASAVVIVAGRVIRIYSDGSMVPMVGPGYVYGEPRLDPHAKGSLLHRTHAQSLRNARRMGNLGWKKAMRGDLALATRVRRLGEEC